MFVNTAFLCGSVLLLPTVFSWGHTGNMRILNNIVAVDKPWKEYKLGHEITGKVAQKFLSKLARDCLKRIFPEFHGSLASVAAWADKVKDDPVFASWSKPLHYAAPKSQERGCHVYVDERDCKNDNCVVGAITNFTQQLKCPADSDADGRTIALKFLIHFLGDITQPLHLSRRDRGGTETPVRYRGQNTSLHSIWDTNLIHDRLLQFQDYDQRPIDAYAQHLASSISRGDYQLKAKSWIPHEGIYKRSPQGRLQVVIDWAEESSSIACRSVWPGFDQVYQGRQGLKGYYNHAVNIVDEQLAKAGYRMAHWLNHLFQPHSCQDASRFRSLPLPRRPNFAGQSYLSAARAKDLLYSPKEHSSHHDEYITIIHSQEEGPSSEWKQVVSKSRRRPPRVNN